MQGFVAVSGRVCLPKTPLTTAEGLQVVLGRGPSRIIASTRQLRKLYALPEMIANSFSSILSAFIFQALTIKRRLISFVRMILRNFDDDGTKRRYRAKLRNGTWHNCFFFLPVTAITRERKFVVYVQPRRLIGRLQRMKLGTNRWISVVNFVHSARRKTRKECPAIGGWDSRTMPKVSRNFSLSAYSARAGSAAQDMR